MTMYAKIGAFVAWTLLVVLLTHRYDEGRAAIVESGRVAVVAEHKAKVENKVEGETHQSTQKSVVYVDRVRTEFKIIYKEAERHEDSGLDSAELSAGWVRIFNEGARAGSEGVPGDTAAGPVDDAAGSGITAAQALPTIADTQERYYIEARKLAQCQEFVLSLAPFYKVNAEVE